MEKASSEAGARIGSKTVVRAMVTGSEDLAIAGRLEGSIELGGTLVVESGGVIKADIIAVRVRIAGIVVGNIAATESIQIGPEGRVLGDLRAPKVSLLEGGRFSGKVEMKPVELRLAEEAVTQLPTRLPERAFAEAPTLAAREWESPRRSPDASSEPVAPVATPIGPVPPVAAAAPVGLVAPVGRVGPIAPDAPMIPLPIASPLPPLRAQPIAAAPPPFRPPPLSQSGRKRIVVKKRV